MRERRVWIAQCLCPDRHCIMANAGEADNENDAREAVLTPLRQAIGEALMSRVINPWYGLCNASVATWRYELGRTAFGTIEEAMPALKRLEALNIAAAATFGDMRRSD